MYANPPTWNFPVQACDSNYITLKQIQIIDTLVAKFRKAHNATPRHDTFKTPGQASPNPSNFGDTWKYLCSMLMLYLLLELCSVLVETFGRVPQSQKARVGRPLKWAQSGCLLPHFRRTREAPTASPKSLPISGAENEPSGHGEVLLL